MAKDKLHLLVKEVLINDGWHITHDPYQLKALGMDYEVDIGAEQVIAAEKEAKKIAVEVKSFMAGSMSYDFHTILGQCLNYIIGLEVKEPDRMLYLAVPFEVYNTFFQREGVQIALKRVHVNLIIFEPQQKTIHQWIEN